MAEPYAVSFFQATTPLSARYTPISEIKEKVSLTIGLDVPCFPRMRRAMKFAREELCGSWDMDEDGVLSNRNRQETDGTLIALDLNYDLANSLGYSTTRMMNIFRIEAIQRDGYTRYSPGLMVFLYQKPEQSYDQIRDPVILDRRRLVKTREGIWVLKKYLKG